MADAPGAPKVSNEEYRMILQLETSLLVWLRTPKELSQGTLFEGVTPTEPARTTPLRKTTMSPAWPQWTAAPRVTLSARNPATWPDTSSPSATAHGKPFRRLRFPDARTQCRTSKGDRRARQFCAPWRRPP